VSSITCDVNEYCIKIASKTKKEHEGKKYNLMLRSVLVLISNLLKNNKTNKNCMMIKTYAINIVTEISIKKYFNVVSSKNENYAFTITCDKPNKKNANNLLYLLSL